MMCFSLSKITFCILFIGSAIVCIAQDYSSIVNKERKDWHNFIHKRFYTNDILRNDSVAFFGEVSKLRLAAEKTKNKELILETDFLKYNFLSSRNYPFYLKEMYDFEKKADKEGIKQMQARIDQAIGFYYFFESRRYEKAIEKFSQSYEHLKNLSEEQLPDKQELIYNIAYIYYKMGYNDTALEYLNLAKKLSNTYYPQLHLSILNTQGMISLNKGQLDNAIDIFTEVYEISSKQNRILWVRVAKNSLAKAYYYQKEYDKALMQLNWYSDVTPNIENIDVLLKKQILLASIYIDINKNNEAIQEIEKLEYLLGENEKIHNERINNPEQILYLRSYAKNQKGEHKEAYNLLNEALNLTKKVSEAKKIELIKQAEDKENIEKYLRQQAELENQKKRNSIIRTAAIFIGGLLVVIFIILIHRQKILYRQKQLQLELEKQQMKGELDTASEKLELLTASLLEKNNEAQHYRKELEFIEKHSVEDEDIKSRKKYLNKLLSEAILTDEKWIQFKRAFEGVHQNFIINLKAKLPELTEAEIRYIVLRKLNLNSKEIASLLGIQSDSIRLYKFRIRKKHNIDDDSSLEKIILNL